MSIEIRHLTHHFGAEPVLQDISLSVADGEMVALLGPSGSGKTTLLRIIAGLTPHTAGELYISGEEVSGMAAGERRAGFVFQHYALFRHMTVFDNIAFGLTVLPRKTRPSKTQIRNKVMSLLEKIQMPHLADRYPAQLSGGQQQRVALARALAAEPRILLLDEPFGALDAGVRTELRSWLRQLHQSLGFTAVFVTHDQEEALEVADRIVVMRSGHIEQVAAPESLGNDDSNRFVTEFLGQINIFRGDIGTDGVVRVGGVHQPVTALTAGSGPVAVFVRPWSLTLKHTFSADAVAARIVTLRSHGHYCTAVVTTEAAEDEVTVILPPDTRAAAGDSVWLTIRELRLFRGEHELALLPQAQCA